MPYFPSLSLVRSYLGSYPLGREIPVLAGFLGLPIGLSDSPPLWLWNGLY